MEVTKIIEECEKINKEYNYFNIINEEQKICDFPFGETPKPSSEARGTSKSDDFEALKKEGNGRLNNIAVSVKDCICVKGLESKAGSKILEGYKPVFDATVI